MKNNPITSPCWPVCPKKYIVVYDSIPVMWTVPPCPPVTYLSDFCLQTFKWTLGAAIRCLRTCAEVSCFGQFLSGRLGQQTCQAVPTRDSLQALFQGPLLCYIWTCRYRNRVPSLWTPGEQPANTTSTLPGSLLMNPGRKNGSYRRIFFSFIVCLVGPSNDSWLSPTWCHALLRCMPYILISRSC